MGIDEERTWIKKLGLVTDFYDVGIEKLRRLTLHGIYTEELFRSIIVCAHAHTHTHTSEQWNLLSNR